MTWFALAAWSAKEFRALAPLWAACAIAVALHDRLAGGFLPMLAVLAYLFGSVALGALSIGHEFGHRTIDLLLAQPVDRRRLFLVKLAVLVVLLAGLAAVGSQTLFDARPFAADFTDDLQRRAIAPWRVVLLVALGSAFLAPALTMLTRSTLAGLVLTIAVPGAVATGGMIAGIARFGVQNAGAIARFTEAVFWPAMFGICAVAAVMSGWLFVRLQALEGGRPIELGWRRRRTRAEPAGPRGRRGPYAALALKELHLYQMPVVLAALYAAAVPPIFFYAHPDPAIRGNVLMPVTVLYILGVAALIGSLASADERAIGTLEWQTLLPVPAWRQWTVKVAVALLLVVVLGFGVPAALTLVAPPIRQLSTDMDGVVPTALVMFGMSLYVSTLVSGGVRALAVALPTIIGVAWLVTVIGGWTHSFLYQHRYTSYFRLYHGNPHYRRIVPWLFLGFAVLAIVGALVIFGYRNHRSIERPWQRVLAHAAVLGLILAVLFAVGLGLGV